MIEIASLIKDILDNIGDGILFVDREYKIVFANKALIKTCGQKEQEVIGRKCYELFHKSPMPCKRKDPSITCSREEVFKTGKAVSTTHVHLMPDDTEKTFDITASPVMNEKGDVIQVVEILRDVTDRKQVEDALRESEERFRSSFEHAGIGMAITGLDGQFLKVNQSICDMVGYSEQEMLKKKFMDITHPDDLETDRENVKQLLTGKIDSFEMEKRYLHKQGHTVWILLNAAVVCDISGKPAYFIGQIQDITDRKQAEEALRKSEERFEFAMRGANDGLWDWNIKTNEVHFSSRWKSMLGYSEKEIPNTLDEAKDLTHPDDVKLTEEKINACLNGYADVYSNELRMRHKDGHYVYIFCRGFIVKDSENKPARFVGTHTDITERKQAEEALLRSEEKYRVLVDNSANPITLIDKKGICLLINPAGAKNLGGTSNDFIGKSLYELFPSDKADEYMERNLRIIESGKGEESETEVALPGGKKWFWSSLQPIKDASGNLYGVQIISYDVTENKQDRIRLEKEMTAVTNVLNDILQGEVDEAQTEKKVLKACLVATDSVYGMIGKINEHGKYDTTTYSSQTLEDCAFPDALAWEMSTGMTIRGIWGWPMLHGKPLICNDLQSHTNRVGLPKGHVPLACFLGVPLKVDGKVVGMVAVAKKTGSYTSDDRDTLIRLASVISVSKQHRLALIESKRTGKELEDLVTQRTKELKASEKRLKEAQRVANIGDWEWDLINNTVTWSDEMYQIFGVDKETYVPNAETFIDLVHPDDHYIWTEKTIDEILRKKNHGLDFRIINQATKEIRHIYLKGESTLSPDGKPVHVKGTLQDITEERRAEDAVKESERFLSSILDGIKDAVVVIAPEYKILFANSAYAEQIGKPMYEIKGKRCYEVLYDFSEPCYSEEAGCSVKKAFDTGLSSREVRKKFDKHMEIIVYPLKDPSGEVSSVLEIRRDVTRNIKLNEELKMRMKELEEFYDMAVGREVRMIELKEEIERLKEELEEDKQ
jgi:PAS domain S-box-containing protein